MLLFHNLNLYLISQIRNQSQKIQSSMQKHQQWLDNRTYAQHLSHLQKIRVRKNRGTTAISTSNPRKKRHRQLQTADKQLSKNKQNKQNEGYKQHAIITPQFQKNNRYYTNSQNTSRQLNQQEQPKKEINYQVKCFGTLSRFVKSNTRFSSLNRGIKQQQSIDPSSITLKEKNLLWQNFLIGKRIIETPPVICKKKLDNDYNKHLRLLKSRKKPQFLNNYRQKKLKQYNENTIRIIDDIRAHASNGKYVLILKIKDIIINKRNPCIKDLQLNLSYIGRLKQANATNYMASITNLRLSQRQFSQQVHMSMLDDYNFYFSVSQKNIRNEMFAFIQIRQLKGLSYLIVGAFCVPINEKLKQSVNSQTFQLSKVGKCIGHISVQVQIIKKTDFTTSNLIQAKKHRFSQQRMFRTQTNLTHQKTKVDGT